MGHSAKLSYAPMTHQNKTRRSASKKTSSSKSTKSKKGSASKTLVDPRFALQDKNALRGFSNPSSSTNELVLQITDYFDSPGDVDFAFQQWNTNSYFDLFDSKYQNQANLAKLVSFDLWALPDFDVDTAVSAVMVLFGVPVQSSGLSVCAAQKTTLLTPTSVSDWVKVGSWRAKSLYADANVQPPADTTLICGGSFVVVDPDTMEPVATKIQYRAEATFAITMPQVIEFPITVPVTNVPAWNGVEANVPAPSPVVAQYKRIQNNI